MSRQPPPAPLYQVPIYHETLGIWCVLNLSNGAIIPGGYATYDAAWGSIKDGDVRSGLTVKRVSLQTIRTAMHEAHEWGFIPMDNATRVG